MVEESVIPCPFLPLPDRRFTAADIQALGSDRSGDFYHVALHYAQSLWLDGFPAKALLLINRALACHLPEVSLNHPVQPYHAVGWILMNRHTDSFIGNPRRHYQHLATRMVAPHKDLRTWRAWACWNLSCIALDEQDFPADAAQILKEGVIEPRFSQILTKLFELSPTDDTTAWLEARNWLQQQLGKTLRPATEDIGFQSLADTDAWMVTQLAEQIWPVVYSKMISSEQIRYMLESMYDLELLKQQINQQGIRYALIQNEGANIGYLAWEPSQDGHFAFIHKLYLLPAVHGRGIGARALQWIQEQATTCSLRALRLRVNKQNSPAIRAYMREGYFIEEQITSDIGSGYVMDDYLMRKDLV